MLIISLIISIGLMALAARSWLGLSGSIRHSQSREAREIAEAGLAQLIESLNNDYAYLLIKDLGNWGDNSYASSICANSASGMPVTSSSIGNNGRYTLMEYDFQGSPFYGGKATIRMRGERLKGDNSVVAIAIVEESLEIKPKSCTTSFGEPTVTSGFPGLLGQQVVLGNNDIFGTLSGNVLCLQCYNGTDYDSLTREEQEAYIQMKNNGSVAGQIFLGPIDLPPVPEPPAELSFDPPISITSSTEITAGANTGPCRVESRGSEPPITHCVLNSVDLNSKNQILTVDTTAGDVRLYIRGDKLVLTGGAAIKHLPPRCICQLSGPVRPCQRSHG